MKRSRRHAGLLALALLFARDAGAQPHPHAMPEHVRPAKVSLDAPAEVPMSTSAGRPTIQVMFGDKGPYTFFVDSGAGSTVINSDLAQELGLAIVDSSRIGDPMNPEAIRADVVKVPSMSIGGATFRDFQAASWDRKYLGGGSAEEPRGVIGFPVFHDVLLTLDYVDQKLRIAKGDLPEADGRTVLPYDDPMGIPEFTVSLGGVDVRSHLDTGSGGFFSVPKKYQDQLEFAGALEEVGHARTVNTEMVLKGAAVDGKLALGQYEWDKPFVIVSDELPMGNVGSRALASFAVTFDQHAKTMQFTQKAPLVVEPMHRKEPVQNASASGPAPSSGIRFGSHGEGGLFVYDVAPDSPAAKMGVTADEKVLAINGVAIATLQEDAIRAALHKSPVTLKLEKDGKSRDVTITFP